jgi:hypothetical protein
MKKIKNEYKVVFRRPRTDACKTTADEYADIAACVDGISQNGGIGKVEAVFHRVTENCIFRRLTGPKYLSLWKKYECKFPSKPTAEFMPTEARKSV